MQTMNPARSSNKLTQAATGKSVAPLSLPGKSCATGDGLRGFEATRPHENRPDTRNWTKTQWNAARVRVTKTNPCPICWKTDYCTFFPSLRRAVCMRVKSEKTCRNGGYWHDLDEFTSPASYTIPQKTVEPPKPSYYWPPLLSTWKLQTTCDMVINLASSLGVDPLALIALGAVWAAPHRAWAFPMHDSNGTVCGIRLRNSHGDKWAVTGSSAGLFIPQLPKQHRLYICEGPTDTAAALTIGLFAVGRPSCLGQEEKILATSKRLGIQEIVIIADHDEPGQTGAEKLQSIMVTRSVIWTPPAKDLREAVRNGLTAQMINNAIRDMNWKQPKENQPNVGAIR
jgi:hypothetical protein